MGSEPIHFGANIRAFRNKKKISLIELSERTGIAASNLSSIELGKSFPTLNTLMKIAAAFEMKAGIFLDEVLYNKTVKCPKGLGEIFSMDSEKVSVEILTSRVALNCMESKIISLHPSATIDQSDKIDSDRFIYCLSGEITILVSDEENFLQAGDSLYIMPEVAARLENRGWVKASALVVSLTDRGRCR